MERDRGGDRRRRVQFRQRPRKEFIELLRGTTELELRINRSGQEEVQVRIGTSRRNSLGIPMDELVTLRTHLDELLEKKEELVAKVKEASENGKE